MEKLIEQKFLQLNSPLAIRKIKPHLWLDYNVEINTDWCRALLVELNELSSSDLSPEELLSTSKLSIEMKIQKKVKPEWGDYLLCKFTLKTHFHTACSKTMAPMTDDLEFTTQACFAPFELKSLEEFSDQTEVFTDGEMYELYFLDEKHQADLQELCHEHIYLNINQYPQLNSPQTN